MRKLFAVVGAGLALGLSACADPPTVGTVYKAPMAGESYWYSSHCAMYSTVSRSRYVAAYDSKGRQSGGRWEAYTEQVCIMTVQDRHVIPPSWQLCLKADDDPKHKGCIDVPRSTWERYPVGSHYPDAR